MIVSASYRTDIPAFYGRWFLERLAAGFCRSANPYGGVPCTVPLVGEAVDGFVFWTRNIGPFEPALAAVTARGLPFVVQHTLTGYPRALEVAVPEVDRVVATMQALARRYGRRVVVWRYDPILFTSLTGADWHRANFARLAAALAGACDEVVVSFAQIYRKTRLNLEAAARAHGFVWRDPPAEEKRDLLSRLAADAAEQGMRLSICAQPELVVSGAGEASCIDAGRLGAVAGRAIRARRHGNRPGCACAESRDIGAYESCPHGCVYCYAVQSRAAAKHRRREHDPGGEFLIPPSASGASGRTPAARQAGPPCQTT